MVKSSWANFNLPDLAEPAQNKFSLLPDKSGSVEVKGTLDRTRFSINHDFSNDKNAPTDFDFATQQIPKTTLGWLASTQPDKTEHIMNVGWRFGGNQQLLLSAAQLHSTVDFGADSTMYQRTGGINYRYFPNTKWLGGIELTGFASGSPSQQIKAASPVDDVSQHIAGSSLYGVNLGIESSPLRDAKLKIGIGSERLSYDGLGSTDTIQHLNTSITWSQVLFPTIKYRASLESNGVERDVSTGLDFNLRDGQQLGIKVAHTQWNDSQTSDYAIRFAYTVQFGKKFKPFKSQAGKAPWSANLVPEVLERPSYLPKSVLSKPASSVN